MDKGLNAFINFLKHIIASKQSNNDWSDFENYIKNKLDEYNFKEASFDEKSSLCLYKDLLNLEIEEFKNLKSSLKDKVLNKNNIQIIKNPFKNYNNNGFCYYTYQPFGKQNFPDFLIITDNFVLPLEVKSSKNKDSNLPKWNSNIPKANSIYIYTNTDRHNPIIFLGDDFVDNNTRIELNNYFEQFDEKEKVNNLLIKLNKNENSFNPFGLYPKIRVDFSTRNDFVIGNEDSLNIFEFSENMKWKEHVFNFLEGLKHYEK